MNMQYDQTKSNLVQRIILRSAKLPFIYLTVGLIFTILGLIDNVFPLTQWKHIFDLTDKIGNMFIALALVTFIYNFLIYTFHFYEQKFNATHKIISLIIGSIRKGSRVIYLLIMINIVINIAEPNEAHLKIAHNIVNVVIICSISWIAIQIFYTIENVIYQYMVQITTYEHIRIKALYTKIRIIRNIATVVIVIITIAAILMSFSSVRSIGISLLASAGFITALLGLSGQRTLYSLFSGLQIALSQAVKIGDIVVVEKESGIVEEITFTYVTLKLGDQRRLMVPISYFVEKPFENWSRFENSVRSSFHFHVDFLMPIEPLREELLKILNESHYWDRQAHKLQVANMSDRSVEIRVQVSAANADDLSDLRAEVREKMLAFVQKKYPQFFPNMRFSNTPKDMDDHHE